MKDFDKFKIAILEAAKASILPAVEKHRDDLGEVLKNDIFELEGPRHFNRKASEKELYFGKIFSGFNEIAASLQTLEDIAFYIAKYPFRSKKITPERYLQFHVEAYYSEVYILRERLRKYLKLIERQHKYNSGFDKIKESCQYLLDFINETLSPLVSLRGAHVHEVRFKDEGISRLIVLELLSSGKNDDEFSSLVRGYYQEKYLEVKKSWQRKAKNNNKNIRKLLDFFFGNLYPFLFDSQTAELIYPSRLKG